LSDIRLIVPLPSHVDGRVKPGHDEWDWSLFRRTRDHLVGREREEALELVGLDQFQEKDRGRGIAMVCDRVEVEALVVF